MARGLLFCAIEGLHMSITFFKYIQPEISNFDSNDNARQIRMCAVSRLLSTSTFAHTFSCAKK